MYRMLYNDNFLFDPFDETRIVSSASITTNVNAASYLDFTIAANHPLYNEIEQRSGTITLYSDNEKLFQGQITAIDMDMDGNKSVTCSSALDWLKDVQLRPYSTDQAECDEYEFKLDKAPDALDAYFQWLIDQYNAQNKDGRYFTINVNQAADLTRQSIVYFASTSPRSVADAIEDDILGTFGGYLVLRYDDDQLILDLYSDIHEMNEQVIDYGENILDISRSESTDDQYTAVYPIGKTPQYTAEQQKYHDEKAIYDEYMKQRDEAERAAIAQLQKEEEAEEKRITGMANGQAKKNAENALKKRKDQRQIREKEFSDETKLLQDAQKIKDDKNAADKTKPNPITIESLDNGGYPGDLDIFKEGDVVYSVSYVQRYGYKEFVYSDTNIEDKQLLLALAVAKLKSLMSPMLTIDVRAVDQALYNPKHTHLFAGQAVRVRSKPHKVDEFMMVSSIDLDLIDPSRTTATLGVAYDTLTGQQSSFLRNLNSKIVASVDAVDKLGDDVKVTETTLGRMETVVENVKADNELIVNTVGDYKWMTDTAWGKAEDAQEVAYEANRGVTDTNLRIDNIKMETDERIDGMETDISGFQDGIDNAKAEAEQAKQTAEQIRQEAQTGIQEAKDKAEDVRTEANTAIDGVKTDLDATEAKAELARKNASSALGGLSSANAQINGLRIDVNRHQENITNIDGEIVGVKDTISGVAETANSALTVATTNTQAINEQSTRIDTAYSDIEATRTSVSEVKQTADGLKVNLETNYLDKDALGANYASKAELNATSESITSTVEKTYATKSALEGLQNIADAAIETWSGRAVPTASNPPASTWTTDVLKRQHSGDIYYDMDTGKSYRWGSEDGTVYSWTMIADNDITKAIADAATAQQTADGAKQDVANLSNYVEATYTSKSEFEQTSDEIRASVNEVASANETNTQKIAEVSVKADGISAKVEEQAETIDGHTTTIGQLSVKADGLQTKFEQVSTSLDVALANSEELLYNGGFEFGMDGWSCSYADLIKTSNVAHSGMKWARTLLNAKELISTKPIKAIKGRRYRFGVWYKIGNGYTNNYGGLRIQKSTDGTYFSDWKNKDITMEHTADGDWRYVYVDGIADDTVRFMRARIAFSKTIDIFLDDLSIKDITDAYDNAEKADTALTKSSQLEQTLNGFRQTVSETYTTKDETDAAINGIQIGGTNLSIANGYYNVSGLKNFTYTPADDQYDFDVSAASSGGWGHRMGPKNPCTENRLYPWGKWGTCTFDIYAERECTFVTDINNTNADGSSSGNDNDLRSKAQKILPDGSIQPIPDNSSTATHITIPAQQWVRIGIMCYNGNQGANPNHADIRDYSSIGFLSLGEEFHVKVRKIKFEVGNKPTAWSPCPLDMLDKASAETTYTTKSEFTQTSSEIRGKVEEQATAINGHTDSIATLSLKATKFETDISQTSDQVNGILDRTSTLEQDLGGFRQTVSETYTTKDEFDGLTIGGRNVLKDTKTPKQVTGTNTTNQGANIYELVPNSWASLEAGQYMLSVDVKYEGVISGVIFFQRDNKPWGFTPAASIDCTKSFSDAKRSAHFEFLIDNAYDGGSRKLTARLDNVQGTVTFSNVKLERGTKATAWSPAPEDMLDITTASTNYATKTMVEQTETRITQTAEAKYATKTQLSDEMRQSLKTFELRGRQDGNYWLKLGRVTMAQQGKDFHIDYTGGRAFGGDASENAQLEIHVRSSNGGGNLFAVTLNRLLNADRHQIKAFAIDATHIDLYMTGGGTWSTGTMAYYGQYSDFSGAKQIEDISTAEGTELTILEQSLSTKSYVEQRAEEVSIGVVEDFKDGKHGDKLTTQSNLTALKDEINLGVKKQYADLSDQIKLANSDNAIGKNFSFESNNFDGWGSHDNWTIGINGAHTGQYYAHNTIPAGANGNQLISMGSISAEYGHTYKLEYWVKKKPNTQCKGIHRISYKRSGRWEDMPSDGATTMFLDENGTTNLTGGRDYFDVTDSWMKVTTYIIPPSNVTDIRVRIIGNNPGSVETVYAVDDVSLTDYSVAKTINKTMAGISVKADSIVQEVRNDYATKDLVSRSIPGLKNPNFDAYKEGYTAITGWSVLGQWAEKKLGSTSPVSKSEGGTYFAGKSGTTADQTLELINEGYISAYPGMKVQISWWMYVDSKIIKDSNFSAGIIANGVVTRNLLSNYSTSGWKYMTTTVTVPANVNQFRVRFGFVTNGNSGWLRLDSVSITDVTEAKAALEKATTVETNLENYKITVKDSYVDKGTVTDMQTQWNQTAKGFEASIKASSSSISVVNPGFETGDTTGWTATNFKDISVKDAAIFQNTTHRFLGYRDGSAGYKMPILANEGTVTARKDDYIKVSARILYLDGSNNSLGGWMSIGVMNAYSGIVHLGDVDIMSGGWNTVSYNVQVPDDGLYSVWLVFPSDIDESTKILVDDVTMANETEAIHAGSRINALETRIKMTGEGVRVGKFENGTFQGTSALMNSEGSFDILQGEKTVSSFAESGVKLMYDSDADKYQFNILPFKYGTGGSANMAYQGVNLQSMGIFSLNGVPATPAADLISINGTGVTNVKSTTELIWNTKELYLSQQVKHFDGRVLHETYYRNINNGLVPCPPDEVDHCICATNASDTAGAQNVSATSSYFMILHPAWYMLHMQANLNKPSNVTTVDVRLQILPVGATTWVTAPGTYDFRSIEQGDSPGWHTRPTSTFFCKFDVGTRLRWRVVPNANTTTVGSLTKFTITRLPFSGLDTSAYNYK